MQGADGSQRPSGTVTFLFTDIEGSTRLWDAAPSTMKAALERHDLILRTAVERHGGYIFATGGDGFAVAFHRVGEGLAAALTAQKELAEESWPEGASIRVRMGLHTGEAAERQGDYFGTTVNRTARLMATAHGGQIVCSRSTAELADGAVGLRSLGEHRLRDLAMAEQVFQVGDGMFPPLCSVDAVPTNLPTVRTELIGRSDDLAGLAGLVTNERLVTMTGTGGVGKTRLALGVAATLAADFADGCWFIELAPISNSDDVVPAVISAMRAPTTTADSLVQYLSDRRMLLVLDNCEHVLDASADLVDSILAVAPEVHILVTSREPLGLEGEQVRRVQSLGLPEADDSLAVARTAPAVRLFEERALAANERFRIDSENSAAIIEICRHLDGIPLAIELAAARSRSMAPTEIARRLGERFRLLSGGSRRAQERHRTLFATVSWSHDLLDDDDKTTFRRLSVFPASFDLGAAESVVGTPHIDVVDSVLRLVDRSLVAYQPDADRYRLLETLRQYGADRLVEVDEVTSTRARHARHFLAVADRLESGLVGADYHQTRIVAIAEADNIRSAADWCIETGSWTELAAMCRQLWYYLAQDGASDCQTWYRLLLDHTDDLGAECAVDIAGDYAWLEVSTFGNYEASIELALRSHALAEAAGVRTSPYAWNAQAQSELYTGRFEDSLRHSERAFHQADERGLAADAVTALCMQTVLLDIVGERGRSADAAADALERAELQGHPILINSSVISMMGAHLTGRAEPDFAASFELLSTHDLSLDVGGLNDCWRDVMWGMTLLGLGKPGAPALLAAAARGADRLNAGHVLDLAVRELAVAASDAGLVEQAVTLAAYAEETLRPYRIDNPGQIWLQVQVDRALARAQDCTPEGGLRRGDLMALVDEVEVLLSYNIGGAVRRPERSG